MRIAELEATLQDKLTALSEHVLARKPFRPADTEASYTLPAWSKAMSSLIPLPATLALHRFMYRKLIQFYAVQDCVGCGICETVCPSGRIEIRDGRPVWHDAPGCYGCMACINYCPQQAIQVKSRFPISSYTQFNARYHHPAVPYEDIAQQQLSPATYES